MHLPISGNETSQVICILDQQCCAKGQSKNRRSIVSGSPMLHITQLGAVLNVQVPPLEHRLCVQPIYKYEPGKEFNVRGAS
jgi:hypothetical protein